MGNVHTIIQVKPRMIGGEGAAVQVRYGGVEFVKRAVEPKEFVRAGKTYSYYHYTRFAPSGSNVVINNLVGADTSIGMVESSYLLISSGGKMWCGYDEFIDHIRTMSLYLEDALFYVMDEHGCLDEFEIISGDLHYQRISESYDHFSLDLMDHIVSKGHIPIPDLSYQLDLSCWEGFEEFTLNLTEGLSEFEINWDNKSLAGNTPHNHLKAIPHKLPEKYYFLLNVTSKHHKPTMTDFKQQVTFTKALIKILDELGCWATISKGFANEDFVW